MADNDYLRHKVLIDSLDILTPDSYFSLSQRIIANIFFLYLFKVRIPPYNLNYYVWYKLSQNPMYVQRWKLFSFIFIVFIRLFRMLRSRQHRQLTFKVSTHFISPLFISEDRWFYL